MWPAHRCWPGRTRLTPLITTPLTRAGVTPNPPLFHGVLPPLSRCPVPPGQRPAEALATAQARGPADSGRRTHLLVT